MEAGPILVLLLLVAVLVATGVAAWLCVARAAGWDDEVAGSVHFGSKIDRN